ncbi:transglutaminase-like domain-containing protein [Paenibacillus lutimineralis]|uniref:Transglutaminase domain-containing protein n=1 Tax=Paenibacillus lutimineralis TaxID=2707005 RepID=A0A3Q9IFE7_9BACL|nr:transglutaminase-like domain-containing protein [Paenibacillus lutimineralis]AZS17936.1 transglutaminase domain-containing protein [Paenibacillus lutimineralis]
MRNVVFVIVGLFALLMWAPAVQAAQSEDWLGLEQLDRGAVVIRYDVKADVKTKLMITKGQDNYTYVLSPNKQQEAFPLQMGNGDYTVIVLEQVSGTKYQIVQEAPVTLQLTNDSKVFLNSVQNIDWNERDKAVQLAKKLTRSTQSDEEKVQAVYEYIIGTIQYDKAIASSKLTDYLPDINRTIAGQKGICYDYASLFASMLRSIDIPAKLVMGTSQYVDVYHAWNEVYLNGKWVTIDTTVDASWKVRGAEFKMIKDASLYSAAKYY